MAKSNIKKDLLDYDLSYAEVVKLLKEKGVELSSDFYDYLEEAIRTQSFTVSGLTTIQEIKSVQDSLAKAIDRGMTFNEWQDSLSDDVLSQMTATPETVFRTNIQTAYNEAQYEQAKETIELFPYFMYSAIGDARTRPEHLEWDGFIAPVDDPIWELIGPPNPNPDGNGVYNCRCSRIQLTEAQAIERGYDPETKPPKHDKNKTTLEDYYLDQASDLDAYAEKKALEFLGKI